MSIRSIARSFLSPEIKARIRIVGAGLSFIKSGGTIAKRECNVCGYKGFFYPFGIHLRRDAGCPSCGSLERQRVFKLWFDNHRDEFLGKSILHFAPERSLTRFISPVAGHYVTADRDAPADQKLDIETFRPAEPYDVIIALHILEHVDDFKALAAIKAALSSNGLLLAMVPIADGLKTFSDATITSPQQRELYFGQFDHVRYYGREDFARTVTEAGFMVEQFIPTEPLIARHSLVRGDTLFVCRSI